MMQDTHIDCSAEVSATGLFTVSAISKETTKVKKKIT